MANNGNSLTDEQIVAEFKRFGENIQLPIKHTKRKILIKKLNHLRSRHNKEAAGCSEVRDASTSDPPSLRDHLDKFSSGLINTHRIDHGFSDDSDLEGDPVLSTHYHSVSSDYDPDANPRTWRSPERAELFGRDQNKSKNIFSFMNKDDKNSIKRQGAARIYPDLSSILPGMSRSDNSEMFESSDSDESSQFTSERNPYSLSLEKYYKYQKDINRGISPTLSTTRCDNGFGNSQNIDDNQNPIISNLDRSRATLIKLAVFFIVIALIYLAVQNNENDDFPLFSAESNMGSSDHLLICTNGVKQQVCYDVRVIDKTLPFLQTLFEDLSVRKGNVICGSAKPGDEYIDIAHLKFMMGDVPNNTTITVDEVMNCCLDHILANPHWNIRALAKNGTTALTLSDVAKLKSEVASMGIFCRLLRSFNTTMSALCILTIASGLLLLLVLFMREKQRRREIEQREVFAMVEHIIEILQDHYEEAKKEQSDELPYLAVQHVRDQLIPPALRYKIQPIWDKAVAFISANESRIRLETRLIDGDEFEVWRWLQQTAVLVDKTRKFKGSNNSSNRQRPNQDGAITSTCLKVSNIHINNIDNRKKASVIKAILERCQHIDSIECVNFGSNAEEDSVYIKCSDLHAARMTRVALQNLKFGVQEIEISSVKPHHNLN